MGFLTKTRDIVSKYYFDLSGGDSRGVDPSAADLRVSLKRKESWYSFMYWEDLASSRNREYTLLMSSTCTSVPWATQHNHTHTHTLVC